MIVHYSESDQVPSVDRALDGQDNSQGSIMPCGRPETRVSHLSQGLYMKHLLKHLTTPNLTISEIFARLYSSFTQGTIMKKYL